MTDSSTGPADPVSNTPEQRHVAAPAQPSRRRIILLVDDDDSVREAVAAMLRKHGHAVLPVNGVLPAVQALATEEVALVVSDMRMPHLSGLDLLQLMRQGGYEIPVVLLTGHGSIEQAVEAMQAGATNYLTKPIGFEELGLTMRQALQVADLRAENVALRREVQGHRVTQDIMGKSAALSRLLESVRAAATSRATVLLEGESGTGKELLARAIHRLGDGDGHPFVRINCAAIPEGLIESTLFGHEKGAFTGALKRHVGAFERADGGTLLLDEISEMRLDLQAKLLRVLQEREFERVGGGAPIRVDVRVVATTNRDLKAHVAAGRFRQDLYYRLDVLPIMVPPLRERVEDISLLAHHFAAKAAAECGKRVQGIEPDALALLERYSWPGNIRELEHAVQRAVILASGPLLERDHFAQLAQPLTPNAAAEPRDGGVSEPGGNAHAFRFDDLNLERIGLEVIHHALRAAEGNRTRAADLLGVDVRTLRRKLNAAAQD